MHGSVTITRNPVAILLWRGDTHTHTQRFPCNLVILTLVRDCASWSSIGIWKCWPLELQRPNEPLMYRLWQHALSVRWRSRRNAYVWRFLKSREASENTQLYNLPSKKISLSERGYLSSHKHIIRGNRQRDTDTVSKNENSFSSSHENLHSDSWNRSILLQLR